MVGSFPILDMVVAILSHPMIHLALYVRTGRYHWLSPSTDTWPSSSGHYSVSEALKAWPLTCRRTGNMKTRQTGTAY